MERKIMGVYKMMTVVIAVAILQQLYGVWRTGRELRVLMNSDALLRHSKARKRTGVLLVIAVFVIEIQSFESDRASVSMLLLYVHLTLVGIVTIMGTATALLFTGVRYPSFHQIAAYTTIAVFFAVVVTGFALLYQVEPRIASVPEREFTIAFVALVGAVSATQFFYRRVRRAEHLKIMRGGTRERWLSFAICVWTVSMCIYPLGLSWFDVALPFTDWVRWSGALGMLVCIPLSIWVFEELGSHFLPHLGVQSDHALILTGPYRLVRHPMYTTLCLCALSAALLSANVFVAAAGIMVAFNIVMRIPEEEAMLLRHFGEDYRVYRETTGTLLPRSL